MCTAARYLTHYKEADNADTAKSYAVGVVGQGQGWRPFSLFFVRVALAGIISLPRVLARGTWLRQQKSMPQRAAPRATRSAMVAWALRARRLRRV